MKALFWLSLWLIGYTYVGYPLWLYCRSRRRSLPASRVSVFPTISIILAVHNEAEVLAAKLANLTNLDYPADLRELLVVSDGSTDATNAILEKAKCEGLHAIIIPEHKGKAWALNVGMRVAQGEILIFTDARQRIEPGAVRELVANFADLSVGCVSGELILETSKEAAAVEGIGLYWNVEKKIRQWESSTDSVVGATGALYALRRKLAVPLPAGTILDDLYLPLNVARQGARVIFEPRARAIDKLATTFKHEFRRKVRTLTGNYQLVQLAPWVLTPSNPLLFEFVSHKLLRLFAPFALLAALFTPMFLEGSFYKFAAVVQLAFYASAALALGHPKLGIASRPANVALTFLTLNMAAVVALVHFVTGRKEVWIR